MEENKIINEPENPLADGEENPESEANPIQPQSQPQLIEPMQPPASPLEQVRIGDLVLGSCSLNAGHLSGIAIQLLKDKSVIEYLENCKQRRTQIGGSYFG